MGGKTNNYRLVLVDTNPNKLEQVNFCHPIPGNGYITNRGEVYKINIMKFTKLVPEIYYADIRSGLKTFVDCLEFSIGHDEIASDNPFCVVDKDGLSIMLFQNKEYAEKFTPLLRLVTNNIEEIYKKVESKYPEILHPNLAKITLRPWGAKEFALLDGQIGIVIQQW